MKTFILPMFKDIRIAFGYTFKMFECVVRMLSLKPFLFVAYPFSKPLGKHLKQPPHFRLSKHSVIVESSTYFEPQHFSLSCSMKNAPVVYLYLEQLCYYSPDAHLAYGRSKSHLHFTPLLFPFTVQMCDSRNRIFDNEP